MLAYYAFFDSLVGFGTIQQNEPLWSYRIELLNAMEVFIVGHEYGHFISSEMPRYRASENSSMEEKHADMLGFCICRWYGSRTNSWSAFTGAATLLFFRATRLCEYATHKLVQAGLAPDKPSHDPHPSLDARLGTIMKMITEVTIEDQRSATIAYIDEMIALCDEIDSILMDVLDASLSELAKRKAD